MKKMWKEYVTGLNAETIFYYKDEFAKVYPSYKTTFPVVLLATDKNLFKLISDKDFKTMNNDLTDLISLMSKRLADAKK